MKETILKKHYLGVDVGGTKTIIAIGDQIRILWMKKISTDKIKTFEDIAKKIPKKYFTLKTICIAAAGPVILGQVKLTNSDTLIKKTDIKALFPKSQIEIVNDMEGFAYGVSLLNQIQSPYITKKKSFNKRALAIAIGTGAGKVIIAKKKGTQVAIPSEIGEEPFKAEDPLSSQMRKILKRDLRLEDFISGPGIETIYQALSQKKKTAKTIMNAKDKHAKETKEIFSDVLISFIEREGINCLPEEIFLGGSVLTENPLYTKQIISQKFAKKEPAKSLLNRTSVRLVKTDEAVVLGALNIAKSLDA